MDLDREFFEYKNYIAEFASTIDPSDQLPLRINGYCLQKFEIYGEILEWILNYLGRSCPSALRIFLVQKSITKVMEKVKKFPNESGFDPSRNVYQPLKLVKIVVGIVNDLILDLQDNSKLYEILPPPISSLQPSELAKMPPKYSVEAIKNSRRTMEDKHMIIDDFNAFFNTQDTEPTFYYGIFDGHSGTDAASYANSHLNYNIAVHPKYPSNIETAMREAFLVTDVSFLKKAKAENLNSGTTALCAMYRKTEKKLFVGWCGDSQALIARVGNVRQIVRKHSPEDESERKRIENLGGVVLFWGNSYRVNGSLGVSRAIGDLMHKPFVSAEPEIECISLDGEEDFIVLACDGLWDVLSEDQVAINVYKKIKECPENYRTIASELCSLAKSQGSRDNISVIVVFLKEPQLIATQSWSLTIARTESNMENLNLNPPDETLVTQPMPSIDALGNTNQDFFTNTFGDFTNQFINDVTKGKSTEITDLVMQQQSDNSFRNLTDNLTNTLNTINNNKLNDGRDDLLVDDQVDEVGPISNDNNNNSDNNLGNSDMGPETNVDTFDEDFDFNTASGGLKENSQMEFKEKEDEETDTLENKVFGQISLKNSELMIDTNPFLSDDIVEQTQEALSAMNELLDNKQLECFQQNISDAGMTFVSEAAGAFEKQKSDVTEAVQRDFAQQQEINLDFLETTHQAVAESGGEDSEDEWNYIKIDQKVSDSLAAVEESSEPIAGSPFEDRQFNEFQDLAQIGKQHEELPQSSNKDFEQEKCLEQSEEPERHTQDEIEKDLQLMVETEEFDEMSQLNPDAKEFIPVSPTRVNAPSMMSPPRSPLANLLITNLVDEDAVVAQSPKKGDTPAMEDIQVPSEKDFDSEIDTRPHEISDFVGKNDSSPKIDSPEHLNSKEAMQRDDKLEQEYKDETQPSFEEEKQQTGNDYKVLESSFTEYSNGFQNVIDDAMNRSFYEGRDDDILKERHSDVLNTVQQIPTFEDERSEVDHRSFTQENDVLIPDMLVSGPKHTFDSFSARDTSNKIEEEMITVTSETLVDQDLSSAAFPLNTIQAVEETVRHETSSFEHVQAKAEVSELQSQPEIKTPIVEPKEKSEQIKAEGENKAVASSGVVAEPAPEIIKKKASDTAVKTENKKEALNKLNPVPAKRAPISKPSAGPATVKLTATKKAVPVNVVKQAAKPISAESTTKPKLPATVGIVKRPLAGTTTKTTADSVKQPLAAKTTTLSKRPTSSVAATKPPPVRTAAVTAKPKLTTVPTEKKSETAPALATRAPIKLKTLATTAAKPKLNGTSPLPAKSPAKPLASTRISLSATEKPTSLKDKVINRTVASAPKSPRTATNLIGSKPGSKDLKSSVDPVTKVSSSLSAIASKRPVSSDKKPLASAPKKSPVKSVAVKKTTITSTIIQKKVVNGDIVTETNVTETKISSVPALVEDSLKDGLNGHMNGSEIRIPENGAGDIMVLDSSAD